MRVGSGLWIAAVLVVSWCAAGDAQARCQTGLASAPYIGAADMRGIERDAARLPRAKVSIDESIGAPVPPAVKRVRVPKAVAKVLPQYKYAGYSAFRIDGQLAIANSRGTLSYLLPLEGTGSPGNCP